MNPTLRSLTMAAGVGLVVISLPYWLLQSQYQLAIAILAVIYACAGLAWNVIGGYGGALSFGHSVYFGIGAYTTALLYIKMDISPWAGMFAGAILAGIAGAVTTYPALRVTGVYFALLTFTMTLLFKDLAIHFADFTGGDVGLSLPLLGTAPGAFQFEDDLPYYFVAAALLVIFVAATGLLESSKLGLRLRATRDDPEAARASGVNLARTKLIGLTISAFGTGIVGAVFVQYNRFIDPNAAFGVETAALIALVALIGGRGTVLGPILGAAVLVPLQQLLSANLSNAKPGLAGLTYGGITIAIVLIERRGIVALLRRLFAGLVRHTRGLRGLRWLPGTHQRGAQ